jgi:hypothetical protein
MQIGEVWAETMAELAVEAVRPVTADREALEVINRTSSDRVDHVVNIQHELLNAQLAQDLQEEQQFYARVLLWLCSQFYFCTSKRLGDLCCVNSERVCDLIDINYYVIVDS